MPSTLTATIVSPCPGTLTLTEVTPGYYVDTSGAGGFSLVTLIKNGDCWYLTVYTDDTESPCYPSTLYKQKPCDVNSPIGNYPFWDGTNYRRLGLARVSE